MKLPMKTAWATAVLLASLANPAAAALSCSSLEASEQIVSINEVRSTGSNPDSSLAAEFVELYFIKTTTTNGWKLCADKNPSPTCVSVPNATYDAGDFWVTTALPVTASGSEFVLCDSGGGSSCASGGILDHLRFSNTGSCGSAQWDVSSGCRSACVSVSSSLKDLAREPDGTGSWDNSNGNTAGSSNGGTPAGPHHIRISHDGAGLTCNPETVTLQACADATCSTLYTGSLSAVMSPGGATVTFSGGSASTTVRSTAVGTVTLDAGSTPAELNATRCFIGAVESCSMSFADSGFVLDVPDHIADSATTITIAAVRKDDSSQQCVPGFASVTRNIALHTGYLNPATGTQAASLDGTTLATASPGSNVSLSFDASGVASASLRYPDVGELRLNASYTGSTGTGDAGLQMTGSADFVARPADFRLSIAGNPAASLPTGAVFRRAGQPFTVQVTAYNASAVATPNFGLETPAETVQLETSLLAPVGGNAIDVVASSGFGAFSAGSASGDWVWDEVGAISLQPRLADGDYLGAGDTVGTASETIGRFVPGRLQVVANVPSLANACSGGFSYQGQPFGYATSPMLGISGQTLSSGNATTLNYDGDYWRLDSTLGNRSVASSAVGTAATLELAVDGGAALLSGTSAPPFDGSGSLAITGDFLRYAKTTVAEAPFAAAVDLEIPAADLSDLDGVCYDPDGDSSCDDYRIAGIAGSELRWGRIALQNAFGPELLDLQVPMQAEYFDGTVFLPHTLDSCSSISAIGLSDGDAGDTLQVADTCVLDSGSPGASGAGCSAAATILSRRYSSTPTAGIYTLWLQAPGEGNIGTLDVTPSVPAWLQFDWSGAGLANPSARLGFGVFAGDRRQIYLREVY